jgi:phage-related protein
MPVVGEAHIIVRAITTNVSKDIKNGFNGVSGSGGKSAQKAGEDLSSRFMSGFNKNLEVSFLSKFASGMEAMVPQAQQGYDAINQLTVSGYKATAMGGALVSSISVLIGSLISIVAAAAGAAMSFTAVIGVFVAMKAATAVAKSAFNGIGEAVGAATQANKTYKQTLRDIREELQQLKFDAEDAALAEENAAIALEKAREGLARTSDLPVDSRARREAELAFKQADLNYRRAKDRSADLNEELKTGAKAKAKAAKDDPYAELTKTQKEFAKAMVALQPIMKILRESIAKGFLPILQEGLSRIILSDSFGQIFNGIADIGKALGQATVPLIKFLSSATASNLLFKIFSDISYVVRQFGSIITSFLTIFMKVLVASGPIIRTFVDYLADLMDNFDKFLTATGSPALEEFFITAGDMAAKFGKIFGNIFGGIVKVVEANFGPGTGGDMLLNWLIEATAGFKNMSGGSDGLKGFFRGIATNAQAMLSGIGGIIKQIIMIASEPEIGEFFTVLKGATPNLTSILKKANSALPTLAELLVKIVQIVDRLTESEAVANFFKTLLKGAELFEKALSNPVVASVQTFTGQIHAVTLGVKSLYDKFQPVAGFLYTGFKNVTKVAGGFGDALSGVKAKFDVIKKGYTGVKKTVEAFKEAGKKVKLKTGIKDYTPQGEIPDNPGLRKTIKAPAAWMRKAANEGKGLTKVIGKTGIAMQTTALRGKLMAANVNAGFGEMAKSNNKFIKAFGKVGGSIMKHPILWIIGLLIAAFATLYTTNEDFRRQINSTFKPVLESLKKAWEDILIALQPVFLEVQHLGQAFAGAGEKGGGAASFFSILAKVVADVLLFVIPLVVQLVQFLAPALEWIVMVIANVVAGFSGFIAVISPLLPYIAGLVGLIYAVVLAINIWQWATAAFTVIKAAFTGATVAETTATAAGSVARGIATAVTWAQTAAQWALNAAFLANPITWIIIAIVALIAGIVYLATQTTFFTDVWNVMGQVVQAVVDGIVAGWNGLVAAFTWVFNMIWTIIQGYVNLWITIFRIAIDVIVNIWNGIVAGVTWVFNFIAGIIQGYINIWIGIFTFFVNIIVSIWNGVVTAFTFVFDLIGNIFKGFVNFGISIFEGFINFIIGGVNMLLGGINMLLDGIRLISGGAIDLHINPIPPLNIPRLAKGGVVSPSPGGSLVNVAEAGKPERVEPLDENGMSKRDKAMMQAIQGGSGGGMNITINASPDMDVNALAAQVSRKIAFQMRKGATA